MRRIRRRNRLTPSPALLAVLLVAGAGQAHAEAVGAAPGGTGAITMTLPQALVYAREHQPSIRSALARLAARQSEARIPRAAWLPQLGATAQLFYGSANNSSTVYLTVPPVDIPRIGGTRSRTGVELKPYASTLLAVSVGQEVFDFGHIAAQAAAADALAQEAQAEADLVQLDVELGVEEAFDAVLTAKEVLTAARDAYKRAETHRDFAQAGVNTGLRPPVDLTRANAELAAAGVLQLRAETGLIAARNALAASIGSEATEIDAVPPAPGAPPSSPGLDEALRLAEQKNPLLVAGLAHVRAQQATTRALSRELLPDLFLSATLSSRAGGAAPSSGEVPVGHGWLPDVLNWSAGLVLQWNLFDATVLARRGASRAREEQARADLATARNAMVLRVERAYIDLQAAIRTVPGLAQAAQAAQANLAQADARFRAGLGTSVDLADAEALLTRAEVELAIGRFSVDRARAELARAIGLPRR